MNRPKPLAAFDLDGTLFKTSMLDAVFDRAVKESLVPGDVSLQVEDANNAWAHEENTEQSYQDSVLLTVKSLLSAMTGATPEEVTQLVRRASRAPLRRRKFVSEAMRLLGQTHEIVIISASFRDVTKTFLKEMAIDIPEERIFGSDWFVSNGRYTGEGKTINKAQTLDDLVQTGRVALKNSCAFGDTISDLGMLSAVSIGVMVNPSATLERAGEKQLHTVRESKDTITHISPNNDVYRLQTTEQILERLGLI